MGDHASHPRGARARSRVHGRRDGRVQDRIDPAAVPADAAVGRAHHRGRRHAPRAVRLDRRDRPREERAGAGDSAGRPAGRERRQPGRAADRARRATDCRVLLYGETSTEDLDDARRGRPLLEAGHVVRAADARAAVHRASRRCSGGRSSSTWPARSRWRAALGVDPEVVVAALRTLQAGVEPARGRRGARRHLDSRRLQLESVRLPRRARSRGGAAGGAAVPGDAGRASSSGAQQFDVNRALSREAAAICDTHAGRVGHQPRGVRRRPSRRRARGAAGGRCRIAPRRSAGCARR